MKEYRPTEKQLKAHQSAASSILFGGAVGGGKSAWLCNEAIQHCLTYPGARVLLARHELTSFKKTTLLTLLEFLPIEFVSQHNRSDHIITFYNGSQLIYGGLGDDIRAIERLKSMELSAYGIDQAEETTESHFHMLNSRLRLKIRGVRHLKRKAWLTANPSSNWVRSRFVDKQIRHHAFIPSLPKDNPFLPSDYEEKLRETLPGELVSAWIEGNWDVIASENALFDFKMVQDAMTRCVDEMAEGCCIGCDPARFGHDETVISLLNGNELTFEKIVSKKDTMETAGLCIQVARGSKTLPIKIDAIGIGAGVVDRLKEQEYKIIEVVGSERPIQENVYKNKRAENYFNFRAMLPSLKIPDDDKLRSQMLSIRYRTFSDGLLMIESKDELKRRGLPSPDRLDALVISTSGEGAMKQDRLPPASVGLSSEALSEENEELVEQGRKFAWLFSDKRKKEKKAERDKKDFKDLTDAEFLAEVRDMDEEIEKEMREEDAEELRKRKSWGRISSRGTVDEAERVGKKVLKDGRVRTIHGSITHDD